MGVGKSSVHIPGLAWLSQCFWCLSHPWICHSCLEMLWSVREVRRVQLWAPCLLPLEWYTCQTLSLSEAQVFLARESPPQLSLQKLGPSQWLTYYRRGYLHDQGNPLDSKFAPPFFTLGVDGELRGNKRKRWEGGLTEEVGRKDQKPGRGSPPGDAWKSRFGAGATLDRYCRYTASFSLWEHLLSFISVSWIYRITLVSAKRETLLRGHFVRGTLGLHETRPQLCLQTMDGPHSLSKRPSVAQRATRMSAFLTRPPPASVDKSPWPRDGWQGEEKRRDFSLYFYETACPSGPESARSGGALCVEFNPRHVTDFSEPRVLSARNSFHF